MITLYGFGNIFAGGEGETKDLRVQWALEEIGLPYRVHALDQRGGELDGAAYRRISPFRQVPVIDDDGFVVAESGAIVLYLATKAGALIPDDPHGRTRVAQWCFAAASTVGLTFGCLDMNGMFDPERRAVRLHDETTRLAHRWLGNLDRHLDGRTWITDGAFTVADIMMACVLRGVRHTDLLPPHANVSAYVGRCFARPAWEKTLGLYAARLGVDVDDIR